MVASVKQQCWPKNNKRNYGKCVSIPSWYAMKLSMILLWKRHRPVAPLMNGQGGNIPDLWPPCLPLSAVTVSLHYLPRCLRSKVTSGKTPTIVTWSEHQKICCLVIVTQQRPTVEQSARKFRNLPLPTNERPASSPLHDTRTVKLAQAQCECHTGKWTVIAIIKSIKWNWVADVRFSVKFWFLVLVPISKGGKCSFSPCGRPWFWHTTSSKLLVWVQCTKAPIIVILFAFTCSPTMLILKMLTESVENHSEFYVCANSCNKFNSSRSW